MVTIILVMILFLSYSSSSAFQVSFVKNPLTITINSRTSTQLDIFGNAMKNAFSNDDTLGKREDAGLKKVRFFMAAGRIL
jgi:hypothetical protein